VTGDHLTYSMETAVSAPDPKCGRRRAIQWCAALPFL
jgi:hypothetical protein